MCLVLNEFADIIIYLVYVVYFVSILELLMWMDGEEGKVK